MKYRDRLKQNGRREVLIDLPDELVTAIDQRTNGGRRALVVEDLVRSALGMTPREH